MLNVDLVLTTVLYIVLAIINILSLISLTITTKLSPMYLIIETMIFLDIAEMVTTQIHNVPVTIIEEEIYGDIFININVFVQSFRWFGQLSLIPILAGLHLASVAYPAKAHTLTKATVVKLMTFALLPTLGLTAPLFTSCCGFKFYLDGFYWNFDWEKPSYQLYSNLNLGLQYFAYGSLILSDVYLAVKIRKWRRPLNQHKKSIQPLAITSISQNPGSFTNVIDQNIEKPKEMIRIEQPAKIFTQLRKKSMRPKISQISPEARLAFCFIYFSVSVILNSICFNVLFRFNGLWVEIVKYISKILSYTKYGAYVLMARK